MTKLILISSRSCKDIRSLCSEIQAVSHLHFTILSLPSLCKLRIFSLFTESMRGFFPSWIQNFVIFFCIDPKWKMNMSLTLWAYPKQSSFGIMDTFINSDFIKYEYMKYFYVVLVANVESYTFLVRDGLYTHSCMVLSVWFCLVSPVFRIVNETSTEANGFWLNQLYSSNSWSGVLQVYSVQRLE
jgi:hypothetical protein